MTTWFGSIDLGSVTAAGRQAIVVVEDVLDQLRPSGLDVANSAIGAERGDTMFIRLAHEVGEDVEIYLAVGPSGWVNLYSPDGHDEIYGFEPGSAEWVADLTDSLTQLLRRTYSVAPTASPGTGRERASDDVQRHAPHDEHHKPS